MGNFETLNETNFNSADMTVKKNVILTDFCTEIKKHIDTEYASITSLTDIAVKFHYSREHISRKFKVKRFRKVSYNTDTRFTWIRY